MVELVYETKAPNPNLQCISFYLVNIDLVYSEKMRFEKYQKRGNIFIAIADSLCCTVETNAIWSSNYTPIIFFLITQKTTKHFLLTWVVANSDNPNSDSHFPSFVSGQHSFHLGKEKVQLCESPAISWGEEGLASVDLVTLMLPAWVHWRIISPRHASQSTPEEWASEVEGLGRAAAGAALTQETLLA